MLPFDEVLRFQLEKDVVELLLNFRHIKALKEHAVASSPYAKSSFRKFALWKY